MRTYASIAVMALLLVSAGPQDASADGAKPEITEAMEMEFTRHVHSVDISKRRDYTATFLSLPEYRHLYGPALAKAFDAAKSVAPDQVTHAIAKALEAPLSEMLCGKVFRDMAAMEPGMRNREFAAHCPPKGDRVVEPDLAANTPLGYLLIAVAMEGYAREKGFADNVLHKSAVGLFLNPRGWLDSRVMTLTISLDAIWLDGTRVVSLECEDKSAKAAACRRSLQQCAQQPLSEACRKSNAALLIEGVSGDELMVPALVAPLQERMNEIRELQEKLQQKHKYDFVVFVDAAVPYRVVAPVVYTAAKALPEKMQSDVPFHLFARPLDDEFNHEQQLFASIILGKKWTEEEESVDETPSLAIDFQSLLLKAYHPMEPVEARFKSVSTSGCSFFVPAMTHDWLGLHRKLVEMKKGLWASKRDIYFVARSSTPWRVVAEAFAALTWQRKQEKEACGLAGSSLVKEKVELFPHIILMAPQ